ncbi:hypothetical protein [Massilia eburnea]|uniref:hypothetical protein n=1 Tax=Massilia eburnea TaxID=1776165 RepID=UPI003D6B81A5
MTLAVLGGAVWLLGRETTLQQIVAQVARSSGGQIVVTGVSGSLYGRMHIGRIVYRDESSVLTLDNVDINWSPLQYFSKGVAISELHVARAESRSTGPSKPAAMPASITPPFRLSIADGRVSNLALVGADGSRTELRAIKLQLLGDGRHWQLKDASAETPVGALAASADISTTRPYQLSATAALAPIPPAPAARPNGSTTTPPGAAAATPPDPSLVQRSATRLELFASGDLAQLKLDVKGKSNYANGDGTLVLAPFDAMPLRSIRLQARDVDPARFDPAWPAAAIDLALEAAINGDKLSGKLAATNRGTSGPLDQQKLPLRSAAAQLGGTLDNASLSGLLIDLGAAGKFTGSGNLRRLPKDGSIDTAGVRLHTDRLDLRGLHGAAISTAIAGDISAETKGGQHTLRAALGEGKLRLDAHATLQDLLLTLHQARITAGQGSITATAQASLKDDKAFKANALVKRFDPAALGAFPSAELNAELQANGKLVPDWRANAHIALQPSKLMGQPLSGGVKLAADARHIGNIDARLAYARNNATARGAFGAAGDKLEWQLDAAQLSVLAPQLQGSATASGILSGGYQAPPHQLHHRSARPGVPGPAGWPARASRSDGAGPRRERDPRQRRGGAVRRDGRQAVRQREPPQSRQLWLVGGGQRQCRFRRHAARFRGLAGQCRHPPATGIHTRHRGAERPREIRRRARPRAGQRYRPAPRPQPAAGQRLLRQAPGPHRLEARCAATGGSGPRMVRQPARQRLRQRRQRRRPWSQHHANAQRRAGRRPPAPAGSTRNLRHQRQRHHRHFLRPGRSAASRPDRHWPEPARRPDRPPAPASRRHRRQPHRASGRRQSGLRRQRQGTRQLRHR